MATKVLDAALVEETYRLEGLDCADCAKKLVTAISRLSGVEEAQVNFATATLSVRFHPGTVSRGLILAQVQAMGYGIAPLEAGTEERVPQERAPQEQASQKGREHLLAKLFSARLTGWTALASGIFFFLGLLGGWAGLGPGGSKVMYLAAIITGGFPVARRGLASLRQRVMDMNVLMTVAVTGAVIIGEWTEGAAVAFLFAVSELLESYTMEKTRQSIRRLMEVGPSEVLVRREGQEVRVPLREVREGEVVIVRAGERIPVDGRVLQGESAVNQAPITGESVPVPKRPGSEVFAGTVNGEGVLEVLALQVGQETVMARIARLVEEAQEKKAPAERLVDRFARYYTPGVMTLAGLMAFLPPLLFRVPWHDAFYRALALMVVACPCAFVISTPVTIISAMGGAARHGILIKGGAYLEALSRLRGLALDKTGTLTLGRPSLQQLHTYGWSREEALRVAAALERRSEHPVAVAILQAAGEAGLGDELQPDNYQRLNGLGVRGTINGVTYTLGSPRLLETGEKGLQVPPSVWEEIRRLEGEGQTVLALWTEERVLAVFGLADQPRQEAVEAVQRLHALGVSPLVMLTGDQEVAAQKVGAALGLDQVRAGLRPEEKLQVLEELLANYTSIGMVGDGINDTPALARATVGIAMGGAGTAAALEAADMVLMTDNLALLPAAVAHSRRAMRVLRQNITLAVGIKLLAVVLAAAGWLTMWLGVAADMGASLLVTLNGMRLLASRVR